MPPDTASSGPAGAPGAAGRSLSPPGAPALGAFWLAWWIICAALWMCLDDTVVLPELVDGAVAATIGASGATFVYAERLVAFRPRARWALRLWRPLIGAVPDLGLLALVLARALLRGERAAGELRSVRFDAAGDPAEQTARRALATVAGSFTPNTIVLDVDEDAGVMLVHQLVPKPGDRASVDPMALG